MDTSYHISGLPALLIITLIIATPVAVVMSLAAIVSRRTKLHEMRTGQLVIAEYAPPDMLTPAEIGYLTSLKTTSNELYATIFDLERRGILQVQRSETGITATSLAVTPTVLAPHEQYLVEQFQQPQTLAYQLTPNILTPFARLVQSRVSDNGYLSGSIAVHYLRAVVWAMVLMTIVFPGLILFFPSMRNPTGVMILLTFAFVMNVIVYAPTGLILASLYTKITGNAWMGTKKLRALWPQLVGYRSYIQLAELGEIQYNSTDLQQSCRNKDFAYAVALGLKIDWQQTQPISAGGQIAPSV